MNNPPNPWRKLRAARLLLAEEARGTAARYRNLLAAYPDNTVLPELKAKRNQAIHTLWLFCHVAMNA